MAEPAEPEVVSMKIDTFFKLVFGNEASGVVCIAYKPLGSKWREEYFAYPDELPKMVQSIVHTYKTANTYFCPQLLKSKQRLPGADSPRTKENIKTCTTAWADLDSCRPELLLVEPSITLETSAERFHALWVFDHPVEPEVAEQISHNIAYHHVPDGADNGGWDLTQMLRVPYTYNLKRTIPEVVQIAKVTRRVYTPEDFGEYKEARISKYNQDPMPEVLPPEPALDLMQRYRKTLNPAAFSIFSVEPTITPAEGGWSKVLWQLNMLCFEAGMSREEVFVVARDSACNKYRRDNKHPRLLWEEICRAHATTLEKFNVLVPKKDELPPLLLPGELEEVEEDDTFIEKYVRWASSLGDAAVQYHHAGAFMILSALFAGSIRLPTSFGTIMPNLWFMLLADTTLTRKSTAIDLAAELVDEVDPEILLATDGSVEGLLQALETRPGRPSLFLKDEFSGLIDAMTRKDYMAGMAEMLTKLYDGKTMKRVLKRETVTVREPCLLIFGGGIKDRVQSMLTLDHVSSGFIPRFIFLTAESDVSKLQPLGPPTDQNMSDRYDLLSDLQLLRARYISSEEVIVAGKLVSVSEMRWLAQLTEDAWERYHKLESLLLYAGVNHDQPDIMTPVYDRLSKSILKAAVLVACTRKQEAGVVVVEREDLVHAIRYGQSWRDYATDIVNGIGRSANEILLQRIFKAVQKNPGISRSRLMQWYHLSAREADIIFSTLEQRGLILANRMGKTWVYEMAGRMIPGGK